MIIETMLDPVEEGGSFFMKYESDDPSKALLQNETGLIYKEAIDLITSEYTYTEIDDPDYIEEEKEEEE